MACCLLFPIQTKTVETDFVVAFLVPIPVSAIKKWAPGSRTVFYSLALTFVRPYRIDALLEVDFKTDNLFIIRAKNIIQSQQTEDFFFHSKKILN